MAPPRAPSETEASLKHRFDFAARIEDQGLMSIKELGEYDLIERGFTTGSSWAKHNIPGNREILVYIKSHTPHGVPTHVRARKGNGELQRDQYLFYPLITDEHIFKFTDNSSAFGHWLIHVDSDADAYTLEIEVYSRKQHAL